MYLKKLFLRVCLFALALLLLQSTKAHACACGCGIFDVGTSSMLPRGTGGILFFDYDYQNQNINYHNDHRSPLINNDDKKIETSFYTAGIQYMFDRSWGIQAQIPVADRFFQTTDGGELATHRWANIGDVRIEAIYAGFSEDQSSGITFGLKLPTGSYNHADSAGLVDRDTQIGSGSTDLLIGGFYRDNLTRDGAFDWFAQAKVDVPFLFRDKYRPGMEVDAAAGVYYKNLSIGKVGIRPIAQVLASWRDRDRGANSADPVATGYERILLSPGIEFDVHPFMVYADVELPVYQHVRGEQLIGSYLIKVTVSYMF